MAVPPLEIPVPPAILRFRVSELLPAHEFLRVGAGCADLIRRHVNDMGTDFASAHRVLDFGCGCGRTIRWFLRDGGKTEFHGVDVDADAIDWCNRHLPQGHFLATAPAPPLPYPPEHFDIVYCLSVFTHLNESMQDMWLAEISRILKPGGAGVYCFWRGGGKRIGCGRPKDPPDPWICTLALPKTERLDAGLVSNNLAFARIHYEPAPGMVCRYPLWRRSGWQSRRCYSEKDLTTVFGSEFENHLGENLRVDFGIDSRYLPDPEIPGSARVIQSNIRSLLKLVHDLDDALPVEKRQLWSETGENFVERLQTVLSLTQ